MRRAALKASDVSVPPVQIGDVAVVQQQRSRPWWQCWELYLILLVAAFLRFYLIQTTEFDADQANIFGMAYDAVSHAHLVATSNIASVKIYNPPGIIYLLMIPAAFSSNPLGAALMTALLATLGVLLTYYLAFRYYSRLTAAIAASLYATAALPVFYSRFAWNQNFLLCLTPLFILLLFQGVVARRRGWFAPALFLFGFAVQLHGSGALFGLPLLLAVLLAPGTLRRRDWLFGLGFLLLSYASYILWEFATHFNDVSVLRQNTGGSSSFDTLGISFYRMFLSPLNEPALSDKSLLSPVAGLFQAISVLTVLFCVGGLIYVVRRIFLFDTALTQSSILTRVKHWWLALRSAPDRCGLLILLAWQLPVLTLFRHSIKLHPHYLIMFMPGPYLLAALCIVALVKRCRFPDWRARTGRILLATLSALVLVAQFVGAFASVIDLGTGNFVDRQMSSIYYNDLGSLQDALAKADGLAQQKHLSHIYVNADHATFDAFIYLTQHLRTPVTVVNDTCAIIPSASAGPALLLAGPYSEIPSVLTSRYASLVQIDTSPRLGGDPFRLYTLSTADQLPTAQQTFASDLQLLGSQTLTEAAIPALLTDWQSLHALPTQDNTLYSYALLPPSPPSTVVNAEQATCTFTALASGERLLMRLNALENQPLPEQITVQAFTTTRYTINLPPLAFDTYQLQESHHRTLRDTNGQETISLSHTP